MRLKDESWHSSDICQTASGIDEISRISFSPKYMLSKRGPLIKEVIIQD